MTMTRDEDEPAEWDEIMKLRARLTAVLDESGISAHGQAMATLRVAARCAARAEMAPDVACAMLVGSVVRGEPV